MVVDLVKARVAQKPGGDNAPAMIAVPQEATSTAALAEVPAPSDVTLGGMMLPPGVREVNKELAERAAKRAQEMVRVGQAESSIGGDTKSVGAQVAPQSKIEDCPGGPLSHRDAIHRPSVPQDGGLQEGESSMGEDSVFVGVEMSQSAPLSHRHAIRRPSAPQAGSAQEPQLEKPEVSSPNAKTPKFF